MADGVTPVVNTNLGPPATPQTNPIASAGGVVGVMNDLAEMRNRQNMNLLFQQQMAARHRLGEDLAVWAAQGLSPEEQIAKASHQPYAPFVTPELGGFRASNLAGAQVQQTQALTTEVHSRMVNAGLERLAAGLAATGGDPKKFDGVFKSVAAGYDASLQKDLAKTYGALKTALTDGLPEDPAAAKAELAQRTMRVGASLGALGLDKLYGMGGGVAPTLTEVTGSHGEPIKAVVSGGGALPVGSSVLSVGPTTAESAALKIKGEQAAGLPPSVHEVTTASGAKQPMILSGGAGGAPGVASPLLAPGSGAAVVGPGATQAKYQEARGADMAKYQENLDDRVKVGSQIMQTVEPAWKALKELQAAGQNTGGFASARASLANIAKGLGASTETADKIMKMDSAQEIQKLMVNTTMAQITQQLPATSKVAVSEFNAFTKNNPNLDTDPRAIEKIFNFWSKVQQVNRIEQSELNKHVAAGGNISEWPEKWQRIAEERGYINPNPTGTGEGAGKGGLGVGEHREVEPGVTIRRVK